MDELRYKAHVKEIVPVKRVDEYWQQMGERFNARCRRRDLARQLSAPIFDGRIGQDSPDLIGAAPF